MSVLSNADKIMDKLSSVDDVIEGAKSFLNDEILIRTWIPEVLQQNKLDLYDEAYKKLSDHKTFYKSMQFASRVTFGQDTASKVQKPSSSKL